MAMIFPLYGKHGHSGNRSILYLKKRYGQQHKAHKVFRFELKEPKYAALYGAIIRHVLKNFNGKDYTVPQMDFDALDLNPLYMATFRDWADECAKRERISNSEAESEMNNGISCDATSSRQDRSKTKSSRVKSGIFFENWYFTLVTESII
jgi:hypothetical protein